MKKIGLYIHIPFCSGKCPYCDFYSLTASRCAMDEYVNHLNRTLKSHKGKYAADTVYIGGGTPSILGTERIVSILDAVKDAFTESSLETTIEVNPESAPLLDFARLHRHGINRVSMGLQSSDETELKLLGRKHTSDDAARAAELIRAGGIDNLSLDLMLGISHQTQESLSRSINFCTSLDVSHISAYILKIEERTPYFHTADSLSLPNDDEVCDLYEFAVQRLAYSGYAQYEISNFSKPGLESRHNLKYWHCEEYLGIGPAAHSFIDKRRFFYGRSLSEFYNGEITDDGFGGDAEEYIAMNLRLTQGLLYDGFYDYFGTPLPESYIKKAERLIPTGMLVMDDKGIRLTVKGFLCSNSVIASILL